MLDLIKHLFSVVLKCILLQTLVILISYIERPSESFLQHFMLVHISNLYLLSLYLFLCDQIFKQLPLSKDIHLRCLPVSLNIVSSSSVHLAKNNKMPPIFGGYRDDSTVDNSGCSYS